MVFVLFMFEGWDYLMSVGFLDMDLNIDESFFSFECILWFFSGISE